MFKLCLLVAIVLTLGRQAVKGQLVGGDDTVPGEFPYQALLLKNSKFFCTGALISQRHILSAGHCAKSASEYNGVLSALIGTDNLIRGGRRYAIGASAHHTEYIRKHPPVWLNDIGIFMLKSNVTLSDHVGIAILPTDDIHPGSNAVVSAAGLVKRQGPVYRVLMKLDVTIPERSSCQSIAHAWNVDETLICIVFEVGKGTCDGDSGAPLVQNGTVIGVLTGVTGACASGRPSVFNNVYSHRVWINEVINRILI